MRRKHGSGRLTPGVLLSSLPVLEVLETINGIPENIGLKDRRHQFPTVKDAPEFRLLSRLNELSMNRFSEISQLHMVETEMTGSVEDRWDFKARAYTTFV